MGNFISKILTIIIFTLIIVVPFYISVVNNVEKVPIEEFGGVITINSKASSKINIEWVLKADGYNQISVPMFSDNKMKVLAGDFYTEVNKNNGEPFLNLIGKQVDSSITPNNQSSSCQNVTLSYNEHNTQLTATNNKEINWTFSTEDLSITNHICGKDIVYVYGQIWDYLAKKLYYNETSIYAIELSSGKVLWEYADAYSQDVEQLLVNNNAVFLNLRDKYLSLDAYSGEKKWENEYNTTSMVINQDILYTFNSGFLVANNINNGSEVWRRHLDISRDTLAATFLNNKMFVSTGLGVKVFNKENGNELWSLEKDPDDSSYPDTPVPVLIKDHIMYVSTYDGYLIAVNLEGKD